MELRDFFEANPRLAIGFSGGVDSAYLLYAAVSHGADIKAYYVTSAFQPAFELEDARRVSETVGAEMEVLELDMLSARDIAANPADRCYRCKRMIFGAIAERAKAENRGLIDGSNASDDSGDRPGMRALDELGVRSPLRECGIDKAEVRRRAKDAGLHVWNKPAYACLATRVPTGDELTEDVLRKIELAEDALFALGFADFRVRVLSDAARLQFTSGQMGEALSRRDELLTAVRPYFSQVLLDLECRLPSA